MCTKCEQCKGIKKCEECLHRKSDQPCTECVTCGYTKYIPQNIQILQHNHTQHTLRNHTQYIQPTHTLPHNMIQIHNSYKQIPHLPTSLPHHPTQHNARHLQHGMYEKWKPPPPSKESQTFIGTTSMEYTTLVHQPGKI